MALTLQLISGGGQAINAGAPSPHEIVVQVLDNGNPVAGKWVTFIAEPTNAVLFDSEMYVSRESNAQGIVKVRPFGNMLGEHRVVASLPGVANRHDDGVIETPIRVEEMQVQVQTLPGGGGGPIIINAGRAQAPPLPPPHPPSPPPRQPMNTAMAAVILGLAALAVLAFWLAFGSRAAPAAAMPPMVSAMPATLQIPPELTQRIAQTDARSAAAEAEIAALRQDLLGLEERLAQRIAQGGAAGRAYTEARLRALYDEMLPDIERYESRTSRQIESRITRYHQRYGMTRDLDEICQHHIGQFFCKRVQVGAE